MLKDDACSGRRVINSSIGVIRQASKRSAERRQSGASNKSTEIEVRENQDASHNANFVELKFATFNVAGAVQKLAYGRREPSEAKTVKRMIRAGAPKWGQNAAEFMQSLKVDLLGVQEMVAGNGVPFAKFMGSDYSAHQPRRCRQNRNHRSAVFCSSRVGKVIALHNLGHNRDVRSAAGVYVQRYRLVFLSVWLNHGGSKSKVPALESLDVPLRVAVRGLPRVERVVVAMDSNDPHGRGLLRRSFKLLGHTLRVRAGASSRSCAEDSRFSFIGDFICDSAPKSFIVSEGIPELPFGWTPFTQLMSDHLPVVCRTKAVLY